MQKMETYREALGAAWRLTWKHKKLWALGLLAAVIGSGSALQFVTKFYYTILRERAGWLDGITITSWQAESGVTGWLIFGGVMLVAVAVFLLFVAIFVSAQGGLVYAVEEAETAHTLNLAKLFHHGRARLGRLLGINVLRAVITLGLLSLAGCAATAFARHASFFGSALFLVVSLVIIVVGLVAAFLAIYAVCFVSLHNKSFKEALLDAWALFMDHALVSLEMSVVLFFIGLLFGIVVLFGAGVISVPVFVTFVIAAATGNAQIILFSMAIGATLFIAWLLWVMAVYTTFSMSSWTVLFMQMSRHGFSSRMMRWLRSHRSS